MIDRENVVWSLERCASSVPDACSDCKYDNFPPRICVAHLTRDALELLTPIKPIRDSYLNWHCGNCRREIDEYAGDIYCPECGRKVDWDD